MALILSDDDIVHRLGARDAVRWMGEAVDAHGISLYFPVGLAGTEAFLLDRPAPDHSPSRRNEG